MKRPFFPLVIALVLGIIFSFYFQTSMVFTLVILGLLIGICIYCVILEKDIKYHLLFLFFTMGILITITNETDLNQYLNKRTSYIGIVDEALTTNSPNGKYIVKVDKVNNNNISTEKIMLNVISTNNLKLGDVISFTGLLKEPMQNTNPKLYNYKLNLLSQKIYTSMTIQDYQIKIIKSEKSFKYRIKDGFKQSVETLFKTYLNSENSQLITSIILGESSYLDEDNLMIYRGLNLAHILAVSGLHIGIISGFLIFLFSRLGIKRKVNIIITLAIIWIYGYVIGYPPSILRSNIMFSLLFYSFVIHEPYDSINTISIACFLLLLFNPFYLFHIGFQLSFAAAFSIVYFTPFIKRIFYPYNSKFANSIAAILAVNLGLLPLQAYYFNRISVFSIFANLLLLPIFSIALILGFIMIGSLYILPFLNVIFGFILNFILSLQYRIIHIIPSNVIKIYSPEFSTIFIYFLLVMVVLKIIPIDRLKKPIIKYKEIVFIILILFNSVVVFNDKSIELHFIDVGQGDSILIRTHNGDYLMDTGGQMGNTFDIGKNITLPYLEKLGINRLKAIFITHFHIDHCQGVPLLVENLNVDNIVASYIPPNYNLPIIIAQQGDEIILDKHTKLRIIWPDKTKSNNENNMSLVGLLSYYNKQVLLTGDIEREVEPLVAEKINETIDILKVPHHGSNTSSTEGFLKILQPNVAVISVGRNNLHNHPSREVLSRYNDINSDLYRTDENGLIKIHFNKENYNISTYNKMDRIDLLEFLRENTILVLYMVFYLLVSSILIKIYIIDNKEMGTVEL